MLETSAGPAEKDLLRQCGVGMDFVRSSAGPSFIEVNVLPVFRQFFCSDLSHLDWL